jgi:hypothetical protein
MLLRWALTAHGVVNWICVRMIQVGFHSDFEQQLLQFTVGTV